MASFTLEGLFAFVTERFTAGVIQSYQGQGVLEDAPLMQGHDPLEAFRKFDVNDTIFQEYDALPGDESKMSWKRSRPSKWWMSLWKALKDVFRIQILGGLTLGTLAIFILVLDFNSVDLCYDRQFHGHWNSLPPKIQAIIVTADTAEAYVVQMWSFLVLATMFDWPFLRKLNLLTLNLLGAFFDTCYRLCLQVYGIYQKPWRSFPLNALFLTIILMNTTLIGREIANNTETERSRILKKTIKVSTILAAQFVLGIPISFALINGLIPLYRRVQDETYKAMIAGALPLISALPKVILRLTAQRIDFIHPGDSHVLLTVLYTTLAIVFRVVQAEFTSLRLFIFLSFVHGAVDLLERLTIVVRDYLWYFIYKMFKRDTDAEAMLSADTFRTPRSMRLIADMSIQMILGESTALIAAVGAIQLCTFMYNNNSLSFTDMHVIADFFVRISIALSIDFVFNSFSFWLQMSHLNIAVVRVWKKKWRKHMLVGFVSISVAICYFTPHLFAVIRDKTTSETKIRHFNCTGPFSRF